MLAVTIESYVSFVAGIASLKLLGKRSGEDALAFATSSAWIVVRCDLGL